MKQKHKLQARPRYTAYVASSIDGRISKNNKSTINWTSKEDWNFFQKALTKANAVIVGHNTFKVAKSYLKKRNTIVLTSKVNRPKIEDKTVFFNPKKSNLKIFLQGKDYRTIAILGGARVYDFCLRHKMMNELFVTIEPYVFTSGVPMFLGSNFKQHKFALAGVKKLNNKGTILLRYTNKYES